MTAVFIALQSEARKKARQDFEKEIPDAEILLPAEEPDPTSNWKTYRNEEYKFEFRYPPHWNVDTKTQTPFVQLQEGKDGQVTAIAGGMRLRRGPALVAAGLAIPFCRIGIRGFGGSLRLRHCRDSRKAW